MFLLRFKNLLTLLRLYICQFIRKLKGKKFIHIIGDSHTLAFQNCALKVHYLGAVTAYNLVKENSSSLGREKLFKVINSLKEGDIVMLVFGEIDSRIHIYNQYIKNKKRVSTEKLIESVILNYSSIIEEIKQKKLKIAIYNIVPPGPQGNIYNYPHYAKWEDRLKITRIMNDKLKNYCMKKGILFVDIFDQVINLKYTSEYNFRKDKFIFDDVHLNEKVTELVINRLKTSTIFV